MTYIITSPNSPWLKQLEEDNRSNPLDDHALDLIASAFEEHLDSYREDED